MRLFVRVKAAGKRRNVLEPVPIKLEEEVSNVTELITAIVKLNVRAYNHREIDSPFFPFLTDKDIEERVYLGKVSFGDRKNDAIQDESKAVENALQCFEDGIFRVIVNENEVTEKDHLQLKPDDVLTFIRLTMLAGRLW